MIKYFKDLTQSEKDEIFRSLNEIELLGTEQVFSIPSDKVLDETEPFVQPPTNLQVTRDEAIKVTGNNNDDWRKFVQHTFIIAAETATIEYFKQDDEVKAIVKFR